MFSEEEDKKEKDTQKSKKVQCVGCAKELTVPVNSPGPFRCLDCLAELVGVEKPMPYGPLY